MIRGYHRSLETGHSDPRLTIGGVSPPSGIAVSSAKGYSPSLLSEYCVALLDEGGGIGYLLSRERYASLGQAGTYTRRKGLDQIHGRSIGPLA